MSHNEHCPERFRSQVTLMSRSGRLAATLLCVVSTLSCGGAASSSQSAQAPAWTLQWSEEFDCANGSCPDSTKWAFETGGNGWGNSELEYYTSRPQNAQIQNGNLVITAIREAYTGPDGVTHNYTSARLKTAGLFSQAYGRFEARIKIPSGQGIWLAFWILGNNISTSKWPTCGEIDIMENIGSEPSTVHGSMHGPGYSGGRALTGNCPGVAVRVCAQRRKSKWK